MFKFVLVCALFAVAISSPIPDEVRKTGNIQKTSEYYLTSESKPPAPKSPGLTRPSPINPNIKSDPKPQDSGKIIPASLTDSTSAAQPANKPAVASVNPSKVSSPNVRTPARSLATDRHVAQPTNVDSAKVPAPGSSVQKVASVQTNPSVSRTAQTNNNNKRPTVVATHPAAHLDSNPSIASPAVPAKSGQPIDGVKKIVKRESGASKHLDHDTTTTQAPTTTDSNDKNHKSDSKNDKPSKLSNNDDSYNRDNQPPKYVHPVPVAQVIKDLPPAEIHHEHKNDE
jgi:hypothetical protein